MLIDRIYAREKIERALFPKQDASGRPLYFPKGALGPGYVITTDEQKDRIVRQYILSTDLSFVAILLGAFAIQWLGWHPLTIIAVSTGIFVVQSMTAQWRARGLTISDARLSRGDASRAVAKSTSWRKLIFVGLSVTAMFVGQALIFAHNPSLVQLMSSALLGLGAFLAGLLAYVKWRERD